MSGLKGLKDRIKRVDYLLDSHITQAEELAEKSLDIFVEQGVKARKAAKEVSGMAQESAKGFEKISDDVTKRFLKFDFSKGLEDSVIKYPKLMVLIVLGLTALIAGAGITSMIGNIKGDLEIYLPADDETTVILNEVSSVDGWSTDIVMILVETDNVGNPGFGLDVKNLAVLNEIDALERELDTNREDFGKDNITYILSISTIVKELNVTAQSVYQAMEDEFGFNNPGREPAGNYAIPQNQPDIDNLYTLVPQEIKNMLVADTNNDGINDTTALLIGIEDVDQNKFMADLTQKIGNNAKVSKMTITGPVPMVYTLTNRVFEEFYRVVPLALGGIFLVLLFFHRTWKIVVVSGVPLACTLGLTFGIIGLMNITLAPQIILVAPILLALGVAYGLYISNRYSNMRKAIPDKEERMKYALKTTGRGIFLSALTTAIGFSSLMFVDMLPLRVLGLGLTLGIVIAWAVTMLTVPSLVLLLDYRKFSQVKDMSRLGLYPIKRRKTIIAVAIFITLISISFIPYIKSNLDMLEMAPQDDEIIMKMEQYSEIFDGGQMGMVVIRAAPVIDDSGDPYSGTLKDLEILEAVNNMENAVVREASSSNVRINQPLSIVDIMKMVKIPQEKVEDSNIPDFFQDYIIDNYGNQSFWGAIRMMPSDCSSSLAHRAFCLQYGETMQQATINIFYNSISLQFRRMLITEDYDKSIIFIDIPATNSAEETKIAVDLINEESDRAVDVDISHLTGFAALVVSINSLLMTNSFTSLVMSLILVFIILTIIFRSLRYAALTMIPVGLVVAWLPLTYAGSGVDMNLLTAMLGSIIVGVGIDFGIHMTEGIRHGGESLKSIKRTVETSGMSFIEATTTIVCGLSSIFIVNIPSIQEFALMMILLLIFSVMGAIFVLPAIYAFINTAQPTGAPAPVPILSADVLAKEAPEGDVPKAEKAEKAPLTFKGLGKAASGMFKRSAPKGEGGDEEEKKA